MTMLCSEADQRYFAVVIVVFAVLASALSDVAEAAGVVSASADTFLSSLGVNTHIDQGVSGGSYVLPLRYLGIRNIRDGGRNDLQTRLVSRETGARIDLIVEGDLDKTLASAKELADSGALMAIEGPNEPNNFPIMYNGRTGGGNGSWAPVAELQRDLYRLVKLDPKLQGFPVFSVSEVGAEIDNVGLQFLTIPANARTTFPAGTKFADYANVHNYVSSNRKMYADNQAWNAADPVLTTGPWDGLFGEYGVTWRGRFPGYSQADLMALTRVTTETGWDSVSDLGGERTQGIILLNTYLAQFKRGWRYTFIYQLRDGEGGDGSQGLFGRNAVPKLAATYIHNLTSILDDHASNGPRGSLDYSIIDEPTTTHDLLLQKASGAFELVLWNERVDGSNKIMLSMARAQGTVRIYDVTIGTTPTQTLNNVRSIPLTLSDHPLVVEFVE